VDFAALKRGADGQIADRPARRRKRPAEGEAPPPRPQVARSLPTLCLRPGRSEAWWWLGIPIAAALLIVGNYAIDPDWNGRWMTGESGILETAQFVFMVVGLVFRPSETIETYLYFFILAYLIVFARRIKELEVAEGVLRK
jgi:hypothetical protein